MPQEVHLELLDRDALDLSEQIADGRLSPADLMAATLDRIDTVNGKVNAIVNLRDRDDLMAEARAADNAPRKGWMHGLPVAVKDLANVKGLPTSMGSPAMPTTPAEKDDAMVARMRKAGAIFIGKTNTPEFGLGSHTFNPVHGVTHNAYVQGRSAGGSSGGAGVALATRMVPIADGSDMMGSLRNPAGWNNVYGLRPSFGRVPSEPIGEMFLHPLSTLGPMGRSPRDVAALLDVQAGEDRMRPLASPHRATLPGIGRARSRPRIGWLGNWGGAYPMEEGILEACEAAVRVFEDDLGGSVEALDAPFDRDAMWQSWTDLRSFAVAGSLAPLMANPATAARLKPEALWEAERGRGFTASQIAASSAIRSDWYRAAAALFMKYDALALPVAQVWPFPSDWHWPKSVAGVAMDTYHRWMEVVVPVSLIGLPCISLPAGFGPDGLPMGVQLFSRHGSDASLLALAQAYHEATLWPQRCPAKL